MSRLVLYYTDSTFLLLEQAQEEVISQTFPLETNLPFARERMAEPIKKALEKHNLHRIVWFSPNYTLFPRVLFDPQQLESYYKLNQGSLPEGQMLSHQLIAALDLVIIYSIPVWLYDFSKYDLHVSHVQHSIGTQLQQIATRHQSSQVTLMIEATHFVLIAVKDNKLQCCTTNEFQHHADILYFLLAHQQKLQLPSKLEISIYDASGSFDFKTFEELMGQFKEFEHYNSTFYNSKTYQNEILCALSEDH